MQKILSLSFLVLLVFSCDFGNNENENANAGIANTLTEDEITNRFMNDFISNPENQDELDMNIIINHVIDHKLDMKTTESGIFYQITKQGSGKPPSRRDGIVARYHGTFLDGRVFDTTKDKKAFEYPMHRLNDGWQEILPMLKTGGKGIFVIPSRLCYGEKGFGDLIPPNTILKFEIELLGVKRAEIK